MKTIISAVFIMLVLSACTKSSIRGSGVIVTENRSVGLFTGVKIEGSGKATITRGATASVEVTGYQNLLAIYETEVVNEVLILKFRNDYYNIRNNNVTVNIVVPTIDYASINGSGEINLHNLTDTYISGEINGSGDMYFRNCNYNATTLKISGSGYINGSGLRVNEAIANISGSGQIDVRVEQKLYARISGSGDINYWGNPAQVDSQVSGSGRITRR